MGASKAERKILIAKSILSTFHDFLGNQKTLRKGFARLLMVGHHTTKGKTSKKLPRVEKPSMRNCANTTEYFQFSTPKQYHDLDPFVNTRLLFDLKISLSLLEKLTVEGHLKTEITVVFR